MHIIDLYRQYGFMRSTALVLGLLLLISPWVALDMWLSEITGWPDAYGFQCRGRGCLFTQLWHSPALLKNGSWPELGLFAVLWSIPVMTAVVVGVILVRRKLIRRAGRIRPLEV